MSDIQDVWCANFSKVAELNDKAKTNPVMLKSFFETYVNTNNEDTFVHKTLHDIFRENFHDPMFELIWANSESSSSTSDKENSRGKNPDFKIWTNTRDENLFGEAKPNDSLSILINKDFVKLSDFQANPLDE
ncbi:9561_t:CDS:2 [Acaulospora colombiana]|uniref:9561_t:CDS:1 n=1 Tax=Acaulospora colombiana TaxID=27376 RepID=A0ACA9MED3_9GLOM|nr:9561_t:CDS:2 [Acaulospora colombiana]